MDVIIDAGVKDDVRSYPLRALTRESIQINISQNQLTSVLRKLFEQMGDANYDYSACAESVVWLESHGFAGVRSLETVLHRLLAKDHVPTEIVSSESDHFTINAGGQTLFAIGSVVVDLGASMLSRSDPFRITITHGLNPIATIPAVHRGRRYPGSVAVWWRSTDEPLLNLVRGGAGYEYPEMRRYQMKAEDNHGDDNVTLVFCTDSNDISEQLPDTSKLVSVEALDQKELAARSTKTAGSGIRIDDEMLALLQEAANQEPVQSTTTS